MTVLANHPYNMLPKASLKTQFRSKKLPVFYIPPITDYALLGKHTQHAANRQIMNHKCTVCSGFLPLNFCEFVKADHELVCRPALPVR